jgi:hypothetical protein
MVWPSTRSFTERVLTSETGPVELGTFAAFFVASLVAASLSSELGRRGERGLQWVCGLFAVFTFLCAMEEVSWGQSLFGNPTPRWIFDWNAQGESNLHNLDFLQNLSSVSVLVVALTGLLASVRHRSRRAGGFEIPAAVVPILGLVAGMAAIETANDVFDFGHPLALVVGSMSEAAELLLGVSFLLVAWLNRRRIQRAWLAPPWTRDEQEHSLAA